MKMYILLNQESIKKIRFLKMGLANFKFNTSYELLSKYNIQSQYLWDSVFNLIVRVDKSYKDILKEIEDCKILRIWCQRNTLHLICKEKFDFYVGISNLIGNWFSRKYLVNTASVEEYMELSRSIISGISPKSLNHKFIKNWAGALIEMSRQGHILTYYGGNVITNKNEITYSLTLLDLITYYFQHYGPASISDFLHWSGLKVKRQLVIECLKKHKKIHFIEDIAYHVDDLKIDLNFEIPEILIFSKFDMVLVSYSDKKWICDSIYFKRVWGRSGHVEAVIIVLGKICGTWRRKYNCLIEIYWFFEISSEVKEKVFNEFKRIFKKITEEELKLDEIGFKQIAK